MTTLMDMAQVNYWFMDEFKAPCCGRPLMQAGQYDAARKLIENNQARILGSGAKVLVASCPICYKVFNEDYSLPGVKVLHHSEYLLELARKKLIHPVKIPGSTVYHDPCELGRGSRIYEQPRELLGKFLRVDHIKNEKENGLCCGGSLANLKISAGERDQIRDRALTELFRNEPDYLATSCPLCKKTFAKGKDIPVYDIAELTLKAVEEGQKSGATHHRERAAKELEMEVI
jgi:Fe-S oxidoreductase